MGNISSHLSKPPSTFQPFKRGEASSKNWSERPDFSLRNLPLRALQTTSRKKHLQVSFPSLLSITVFYEHPNYRLKCKSSCWPMSKSGWVFTYFPFFPVIRRAAVLLSTLLVLGTTVSAHAARIWLRRASRALVASTKKASPRHALNMQNTSTIFACSSFCCSSSVPHGPEGWELPSRAFLLLKDTNRELQPKFRASSPLLRWYLI